MSTRGDAVDKVIQGLLTNERAQYLIYGYRAETARALLDQVWERVESLNQHQRKPMRIERVVSAPGTDSRTPAVLALGSASQICGMRFNGVVLDTVLAAAWRDKRNRDPGHWHDPIDSRLRQDGWIFQLDM